MRTKILAAAAVLTLGIAAAVVGAPSGAIFTTVADGSEVNYNHYAAKTDVYLDGGPGPGAPQHAAALPDGSRRVAVGGGAPAHRIESTHRH